MRWRKYTDKMPEQHAAELHWRHLSDKSPLHMKQHVVIDKLKVEYDAGRYEYDLNNLEYLDDSPPASAVEEAEKLYPFKKVNHELFIGCNDLAKYQQLAHITCAGMYTGEIEEAAKKAKIELLWELIEDWQASRDIGEDIHAPRFSYNDIEADLYEWMEKIDPNSLKAKHNL